MGYSDDAEELLKRRPRKMAYLGNPSCRQFESQRTFLYPNGRNELYARRRYFVRRHTSLMDANKIIYERLQKEFEDARASQTQENYLDGERWTGYNKRAGDFLFGRGKNWQTL